MFGLTTNKALAAAVEEAVVAQKQYDADLAVGAGFIAAVAVVPVASVLAVQAVRKAAKNTAAKRVKADAERVQHAHTMAVQAEEDAAARRLGKARTVSEVAKAAADNQRAAEKAADMLAQASKARDAAAMAFGAAANMAADLDSPQTPVS